MNSKVAIAVDSTIGRLDDIGVIEHIFYVNLYVLDGKNSYKDRELNPDTYKAIYDKSHCLTSSKPTIHDFAKTYEEIFSKGYEEIIVITSSSKVSGTHQSAVLAREQFKERKIHVIDSLSSCLPETMLTYNIWNFIKDGIDVPTILKRIEGQALKVFGAFYTGDLDHLARSGRIGKGKAILGTVLNLKPILQQAGDEGILKPLAKARTMKGVYKELYKNYTQLCPPNEKIFFSSAFLEPIFLNECIDYFKEQGVDEKRILIVSMSFAVATNFGRDTLAISFYKESL